MRGMNEMKINLDKGLTNFEIENICNPYKLFRGVFMRDTLDMLPNKQEIGILNLDSVENNGTHWVLWYKNCKNCYYFDSFGQGPPEELLKYLKNNILASTFVMQEIDTKYCGHLCICLLKYIVKYKDFCKALLTLKNIITSYS
jgi:hypothetical protein